MMKCLICGHEKFDLLHKGTRDNPKIDVITMFQVIEHLENPHEIVNEIRNRLAEGGLLIIETPNSEDVLISRYHCKSFMDHTRSPILDERYADILRKMNKCDTLFGIFMKI